MKEKNKQKKKRGVQLGDTVKAYGKDFIVVGLSRMIYDDDCTGEPEWKITDTIQEVAIAIEYDHITYQKPWWIPLSEVTLT